MYRICSCDMIEDKCADDPCLNGGTCTSDDVRATCECQDGFTGYTCEIDIGKYSVVVADQ